MKAMILAAGLGTRLKPITQEIPKALIKVEGKPLIEHVINKLKIAGFNEIIINVHHFPDLIIDFLRSKHNFDIHIEISDERDLLLDTGGGIKKTAGFFDDGKPFLIHNVDILSDVDLDEVYSLHQNDCNRLATLVVSYRETYRYLLFDEQNCLKGWVNQRTNETKPFPDLQVDNYRKYAYSGIQVVSPKIFKQMEMDGIDKFPIMDFYLRHCYEERIVGFVPQNLKMLDIGKIDSLAKADDFFRNL